MELLHWLNLIKLQNYQFHLLKYIIFHLYKVNQFLESL